MNKTILLEDGKSTVIDATLSYESVAQEINRNGRLFTSNMSGIRYSDVSTDDPVFGILGRFARRVTEIALINPVGSPDFTDPNWKQDYADKCVDRIFDNPDFHGLLRISKEQMENSVPFSRTREVPPAIVESWHTLSLLPLANRVSLISNMINSNNDPELLNLTPKEIEKEQNRLQKMMEEAGREVSFVSENWPRRS
jgi:hypothetical protein